MGRKKWKRKEIEKRKEELGRKGGKQTKDRWKEKDENERRKRKSRTKINKWK